MSDLKRSYRVVIVGGGPVGLFLAILLRQNGLDCVVLEKRTGRTTHSRSLGIHPVSLELMQEIDLAEQFTNEGIKIEEGVAWGDHQKIGTLSFGSCPDPFPFVLSLPQFRTERLLEERLQQIDPSCLIRGAELTALANHSDSVELSVKLNQEIYTLTCDMLVGCDSKDSLVREASGFAFEGKRYPDTYIMGDFDDNTSFGTSAAIFLHSSGLIESFPLSNDRRRWVAKTDIFYNNLKREDLERLVKRRTGIDLTETSNHMLSSFGVQRYISKPMAENRIFLAGDAAHVLSPIGGQGMNLGWLDAWELLLLVRKWESGETDIYSLATQYDDKRRTVARKAIRRAELNMMLGRASKKSGIKNGLVWLMLNTPLQQLMARLFTMRGLKSWPL